MGKIGKAIDKFCVEFRRHELHAYLCDARHNSRLNLRLGVSRSCLSSQTYAKKKKQPSSEL
jgi:hypothetical protein